MSSTHMEYLKHYRLLESLGQGPYGDVYKAFDSATEKIVVVKLLWADLSADPEFRQKSLPVIEAMAKLDEPGICKVYGVEECNGRLAIIEELIQGPNLVEYVQNQLHGTDDLRPTNARLMTTVLPSLLNSILLSLDAAHQDSIIHGNLKPSNIFVIDSEGNTKITDFGLSSHLNVSEKYEEIPVQCARYFSPEQINGEQLFPATDLYSLGAIVFESLTGSPAFDAAESHRIFREIVSHEADYNLLHQHHVPGEIQLLVEKMMAHGVSDRISTTGELLLNLSAINQLREGELSVVRTSGPKGTARQYLMVSLLAVLLIIVWFVITTYR